MCASCSGLEDSCSRTIPLRQQRSLLTAAEGGGVDVVVDQLLPYTYTYYCCTSSARQLNQDFGGVFVRFTGDIRYTLHHVLYIICTHV